MPLKKCTIDGKAGYQWGDAGKCYTGPGAKKKAIKQGVAIEGPKKFSQKAVEEESGCESGTQTVCHGAHSPSRLSASVRCPASQESYQYLPSKAPGRRDAAQSPSRGRCFGGST